VAISGDTAVVSGIVTGAIVYVRSGGTWTQQAILMSSNYEQTDYFGDSVAISGDCDRRGRTPRSRQRGGPVGQ
jgi:hypothetical protein